MFAKIIKNYLLGKYQKQKTKQNGQDKPFDEDTKLTRNLKDNLMCFKNILGQNSDFIIREFCFGLREEYKAAIVFIEDMVDKKIINDSIIRPLMYDFNVSSPKGFKGQKSIDFILKRMVSAGEVKKNDKIQSLINACLYGETIFLMDGYAEALMIDTKGWQHRKVEEPDTEVVVRGPREGFVEVLNVNISLLRRKIRHSDLVIERMQIGEKTSTMVALAYVKDIADQGVVAEVKKRLKRIKTDAIMESGYIEQFIEDAPYSLFPTVNNSEKPDVVAIKLLEGRVAILIDGTPMVLTVPMLFLEGFQSAEDYYFRPYYAFFIRLLRFMSFFISLFAPAVYVALVSFHQELIPTPLLYTIAAAREGTPFPVAVEILLIGIFFEIIREAGIRLPRPIGSAISIVGALVVGQAVVSAGLIGAPIIVVVAITALTTFVVNTFFDVLLLYRIILVFAAAFLGGYGITIFSLWILIQLNSLRSFGVPYLVPFAPLSVSGLKDTLIRFPLWAMWNRPHGLSPYNRKRQQFGLMPRPPREREGEE